jgi:DNA-binding transcriptional ArsR family regulator
MYWSGETSAGIQDRPALPLAGTCCAPLLREPVTAGQAAGLARMLKALADPARLRLVSLIAGRDGGEACVCDLTGPLGRTQPTSSHHLKVLVEAGIFTRRQARRVDLLRPRPRGLERALGCAEHDRLGSRTACLGR